MSIAIIGNVGNKGYALPMVQAYPLDLESQYLLAWNPVEQALDYVPYVGNSLGDFTIGRDLAVTRNASITGNLAVTGTITGAGTVTSAVSVGAISGGAFSTVVPTGLAVQATQVVTSRKTGWVPATGTATRATFDTATITLPQLAERVKALLDDLTSHGLIGA